MARRKKRWSYTAGKRPYTLTVYERKVGGPIYARAWKPDRENGGGTVKRWSLKHKDRDRAIAYADKKAAKLREGKVDEIRGLIRLGRLFKLYEEHAVPTKNPKQQKDDLRAIELWKNWLGADKDPEKITLREWRGFIRARSEGVIDARGEPITAGHRRAVGDRTVEKDLKFLKTVIHWGLTWMDERSEYLLAEDITRGYPVPREENPRRPIATQDQLEALLEVSDRVRFDGEPAKGSSYLTDLLVLANGTARRISAILDLRFGDLILERGEHGAIHWRKDADKMGRETTVPMGPEVRAAVDRIRAQRPGIGPASLFPAPKDAERPMDVYMAGRLLKDGVEAAGFEVPRQWGWHSFRRKWATERKALPQRVDVAYAGGWKGPHTMEAVYQQPDEDTLQAVVINHTELREARG